ncbi:HAMP domain-containing sensor histidine kinase [Actinomycetaceae bacterium L2_0104]
MAWLGWALCALTAAALAVLAWRYRAVHRENTELKQRVVELDRRPAVVSHEIRTPLALVRGAAELLAEETPGPLTQTQAMFVTTIADNTQLVIDMAEDFLLAARFEAGSVVVNAEPVDIRTVVAATARQVRRIIGTSIRIDASGGVLPIVTDERLVRQMVWNLVNNAARHAGPDSAISIQVRESSEGGCTISVTDDGSGMTEEDVHRLFTPFATGSSRRPGSGLGMMIVHDIAAALGGRLMIDTDEGRGTSIMVQLPEWHES